MNILITGGAGFIGTNLSIELLKRGHNIYIIDDLSTGRKRNIQEIKSFATTNQDCKFYKCDITDLPYLLAVRDAYLPKKIDQIYHLACPASPPKYWKDPLKTLATCYLGTQNVLELAKKYKAKILFTSTSEVYGDPLEHPQKESYNGNVNPVSPRSCFSEDTEVLTKKGWIKFQEVEKEDEFATLNLLTKELEYQKATDFICENYKGEMILFKNYQIDLLVTPNHNMLVRKKNNSDFLMIPAFEELSCRWRYCKMLKTVENYQQKDVDFFYFPFTKDERKNSKVDFIDKIKMNDWIEFFGYYITKGSCDLNKRRRTINGKEYTTANYRISIAQDKEKNFEKWKKIDACLSRLPWKYSFSGHQFTITNKQLFLYLNQFGKAKEKFIPQELLQTSRLQLKILFDAMILGDGCLAKTKQKKEKISYHTSSWKLAGNFQELLLKLGLLGNIGVHDRNSHSLMYDINVMGLNDRKNSYKQTKYPDRTIENYNGKVYCVTVPNRTLFVRRNGKAVWCGNCYDEGKRVAEFLVSEYHRQFKLDTRIARTFNTHGPFMDPDDGRVVTNFIKNLLQDKPVEFYGTGDQTRSFCYIDDQVSGLITLMNSDKFINEPVNIGSTYEFSMRNLASEIGEILKLNTVPAVYKPLPPSDPKIRKPDISKMKSLGWTPKVQLREGLEKTIEYMKKEIEYDG